MEFLDFMAQTKNANNSKYVDRFFIQFFFCSLELYILLKLLYLSFNRLIFLYSFLRHLQIFSISQKHHCNKICKIKKIYDLSSRSRQDKRHESKPAQLLIQFYGCLCLGASADLSLFLLLLQKEFSTHTFLHDGRNSDTFSMNTTCSLLLLHTFNKKRI